MVKEKNFNPLLSAPGMQVADVYTIILGPVDIAADQVIGTLEQAVTVPLGGEIIKVDFNHVADSGSNAITADVYEHSSTPASILSAPVDLQAATLPARVAGTIAAAKKNIAANTVISLRGTCGATTTASGVSATITIRPNASELKNV